MKNVNTNVIPVPVQFCVIEQHFSTALNEDQRLTKMESLYRDNYTLRIYRRDADDVENIAGLVEMTDSGEEKHFRNFGELCEILKTVERKKSNSRHPCHF